MTVIEISVKDKIATNTNDVKYICGNSDFVVDFTFDDEWNEFNTKTARFAYNGTYQDRVFRGTKCPVPIISEAVYFKVGVFAGNLHTTTPAYINAKKSILCGSGVPADPAPDVYAQIMELIQGLGEPNQEDIATAVADYISKNPIEVDEKDPTVPEWAKAEKKPEYTADEVGAIAKTELQTAIDTALAQAKASGEFDGADGAPGKDGADGKDGAPGADGQDGITPTIGPNGNWYLGSTDTGRPSRGETGPAGSDGKDGADGQPGRDGVDGQDGVGIQSVEQTTTSTEDGGTNVVTVTRTDGTSSLFFVKNGSKGNTGPAGAPGAAGADGYTPVKGKDYFTESDKREIEEAAAGMVSIPDKLPNPNALTFTGAVTGSYDGSGPVTVNIPSGGGDGAWKHIRKVVIPEDITTDESGVSFSERDNGGYYFAFDTDENGEPFEVGDLFVIYSAGSSASSDYNCNRSPVMFANRNTPIYGGSSSISVPISIGKTATKIYGWAKCEKIENYLLTSGSYNAGSMFYTLYAVRTPVSVSSEFTAISAYLSNMASYGFESGSTFDFYGR